MTWHYFIEGPWIVFLIYWAVGALKTRRTVRTESFVSRYGILFSQIVGFVLLFSDEAGIGILGHKVLPRTYALDITAWRSPGLGSPWLCGRAGIWGSIGALASR
jgi:hypothetical protein